MTDRELLEAAAKAAGIAVLPLGRWPIGQEHFGLWIQVGEHRTAVGWWNPLTDDGDALRLAVKLNMEVSIDPRYAWAMCEGDIHAGKACESGTDPYSATRRAIVRAAAAIGDAT